jgi:hypothetical protein
VSLKKAKCLDFKPESAITIWPLSWEIANNKEGRTAKFKDTEVSGTLMDPKVKLMLHLLYVPPFVT